MDVFATIGEVEGGACTLVNHVSIHLCISGVELVDILESVLCISAVTRLADAWPRIVKQLQLYHFPIIFNVQSFAFCDVSIRSVRIDFNQVRLHPVLFDLLIH